MILNIDMNKIVLIIPIVYKISGVHIIYKCGYICKFKVMMNKIEFVDKLSFG